ncbi:Phosphotransferase [Aphelenchoides bicaudatus]|nr:Phosphotransferase [Aphelenchoides bicaudatus]
MADGTPKFPPIVEKVLASFVISRERLVKISEDIEEELKIGLKQGSQGTSSIAMLPSYVPALPTGKETGKYVAIDLSGKNLRILLLSLEAGQEPKKNVNNYIVSNAIMKGTGEQLFNFIKRLISPLVSSFLIRASCFQFDRRALLWWTKGFDIADCLQQDVVQLLQEALELNMSTKARINAVMNDTVGQLAAAAFKYGSECTAAVVIGYGCNSSYLEDTEKITKFNAKSAGYNHKKMVVVTEWEEFGKNGELNDVLTPFDHEVDDASVHKGKQIIDKLTGALYIGDLVRRVLAQFVVDRVLFNGTPVEKLDQADSFPTKYISEILSEESDSFKTCRRICDELEVPNHGSNDYEIIRAVCHLVSQRSASVVAAAISALLRHMNQQKIKIGVGGALIQFHPTYHSLLEAQLNDLAPLNIDWELVSADEGSVKGAALIAAVAENLKL